MKITEVAVKRPVFAWMIMASFIIFGAIAFKSLGISERPDIDFPVVSISLDWEGAAPEVVELDILDAVESALLGVEGIKSMTSEARRGSARVSLEFNLDKDIDIAVQEIQSIMGQAQRRLPTGVEAPVIRKSNPEDQPILWLSITSDSMSRKDLMTYVRDNIKDRFQTVEGVSEVILGGYIDPNLRVWLKEKELRRYDLTSLDVVNAISREHSEIPSGIFETPTTEFNVRTLGEALTVEEFSKLSINQRGGGINFSPIPLSRVAVIEDGLADISRINRVNGKSSLSIGIRKQRGSNSVEVGDGIKSRMDEVKKFIPKDMGMGVNFDLTVFIKQSSDELQMTLIYSAVLTALVVWIFLGSWSATLNVVLSIPTAIIGTFLALKLFGFTLNTFTMLGLTLAVGLIVDDNIMILENITRKYQTLKDKVKAALEGTQEIAFAALTASIAIIAIFLPIGFIPGIVGKYFFQFALTITAAIAFSFVDAVTLTPMRSSLFLKEDKNEGKRTIDKLMAKLEGFYLRVLTWCLENRVKTLIVALLVFLTVIPASMQLNREFIPPQDQSRLFIILKTKSGSSLEFTDKKTKEIEEVLLSRKEIDRYLVAVGGFGGGQSNSANSYVTLKDYQNRPVDPELGRALTQQEFAVALKKDLSKVKGIFAIVSDPSLRGFSAGRSYPVEFSLKGPNWDTLISLSDKASEIMLESKLMTDVDTDFKGVIPEIQIIPDREKAIERGVSINDIGRTIQSMIAGVVAGKFAKGGRRYDIRVKVRDEAFKEIKDLSQIMIRNNRGELIPLDEVTTIVEGKGMLSINRTDRARAIQIYGNLEKGVSQAQVITTLRNEITKILPEGYVLESSGSSKAFDESSGGLIFVFMIGILIAYMVLASQFNSFIHPLTVLLALPFSITGAIIALWLGGQSLNIYSMIGIVLLMGIVKKNSIILVDFTNQLRSQGLEIKEALLKACPIRLRPIVMTSVSTVVGTIPAAIGTGAGSETRVPLALAVIGGVLLSTLLTLVVIPCFYSLVSRKKY
ncbi:MAG: hypothetical protein COW01_04975 [Bdellovibrionales bacterium CG12_big_fil_rev_8_21_14_0_65_38_15]|nr:MAG: hypothetical protein COW79_14255 [Bdellovibrionales bacterium CG22_combo_CG10-13_8_21_14_all_38_13]PIQ56237.1 MAG: hypothetical protein COW01_04975 [Bdellovibrionales bacterium CG12_big_fil_rev_8_21_14_0_65_38_15]PIR30381.1 MAG: hypothetical protein COV38_06420 [Bdellovibrionales bacterium CG11_big_fil_rev_8_21_14_0_20_38_13]